MNRIEVFRVILSDPHHYSVDFPHPTKSFSNPLLCDNCEQQCKSSNVGNPNSSVTMCMACYAVLKNIDKPLTTSKKQRLADGEVEVSPPRNISRIEFGPNTSPTEDVVKDTKKPTFSFGFARPIANTTIQVVHGAKAL